MAAYADLAAVKAQLGKYAVGLTAVSLPSEADVTNRFLPGRAGIIDGVLADRGLVVPVASPAAFVDSLKDLNAIGAAMLAIAGMFPQQAGSGSTELHKFLKALWDDGLARLEKGQGIPDDAPRLAASTALGRSYWTTHPTDDEGNDTTKPIFTREMEF